MTTVVPAPQGAGGAAGAEGARRPVVGGDGANERAEPAARPPGTGGVPAPPRPTPAATVALVAIVVGVALRVEQFGWRRSLWLDEALVANNIVGRTFSGLVRPLSGGQGAPVGWLWAQRLAVAVMGNNEYALRLVPLVAGVASLVLIRRVAAAILGEWPATLATVVLALAPGAVRYSGEVKQYSSDLAIALGLTLLGLAALDPHDGARSAVDPHDGARSAVDRRGDDRWVLAWWGSVGAVCVWLSHPAVFVLVGSVVVLGLDALGRRSRRRLGAVAGAAAVWAVSFGIEWLVSLRRLGSDAFLHAYWASGFAPRPWAFGSFVRWLAATPLRLAADPGRLAPAGVVVVIAAAGLGWAVRLRPRQTGVLVVPFLVALGAAAVGAFPLRGRMGLWLLPVLFVGLAGAAAAVVAAGEGAAPGRRLRGWAGVIAGCGAALLLQAPARQVLALGRHPTTWVDLRPLLQAVAAHNVAGTQVWVHEGDAPAAAYYARYVGVAATAIVHDSGAPGTCPGRADLPAAAAGSRVWFVYGYRVSSASPDEEALVNARIATSAHLVQIVRRPGASAWLWDFGAVPDAPAAPAPGIGCVSVTPAPVPQATGLRAGPLGTGRAT